MKKIITLLVLHDFNRFLNNIEVVQALDSAISAGKTGRTFVVVFSAVVQIPVELERQFVVIEHDLPGRNQLERIAHGIANEPGEPPEGEELTAALDAAAGLTRVEAENAVSLSLVRHDQVTPDVLWDLMAQTLRDPKKNPGIGPSIAVDLERSPLHLCPVGKGLVMAKPLLPDELWAVIQPRNPPHPPRPKGGRPPLDDRKVLTGIIFILKTGLPWEDLPRRWAAAAA